jgi:hypothetical protein
MAQKFCVETSLTNYQPTLPNIAEEQTPRQQGGGTLQYRILKSYFEQSFAFLYP